MVKTSKIVVLLSILHLCATNLQSAEILDVKTASHGGFTLMVLSCDENVEYHLERDGEIVVVGFPPGCVFPNSAAKLKRQKDDFIAGAEFSQSELRISLKKNYSLKTYVNHYPFQIVLDFTHKPGSPPTAKGVLQRQKKEKIQWESPKSEIDTEGIKAAPVKETAVSTVDNFQRGLELKEKEDFQGALEAFTQAIPETGLRARFEAAMMYEELNRRERAIEALKVVVQESSAWVEPRVKLGMLYKMSGRILDAEEIWSNLFSALHIDTGYSYEELAEQLALAEKFLTDTGEGELGEPPPIETGNLPHLPWFWIILISGTALGLFLIRTFYNWRMNRMMKAILEGEESLEEPKAEEESFDELLEPPVEGYEPVSEEEPAELVAQPEEPEPMIEEPEIEPDKREEEAIAEEEEEEELSESKQKKIYELAEQDYSVAEIAKMLDMGQEEVKFILDFRRKKGIEAN